MRPLVSLRLSTALVLLLIPGLRAQDTSSAPPEILKKTPPPKSGVAAEPNPGGWVLPDGRRLVAATPSAPTQPLTAAQAARLQAQLQVQLQSQDSELVEDVPTGGTSVPLEQRATVKSDASFSVGRGGSAETPSRIIVRDAPKDDGQTGKEDPAYKALHEQMERQNNALMELVRQGQNAGAAKKDDGLTVDPELALIQAQLNPRTGKPRKRASQIADESGLGMIPAGTMLVIRNYTGITTQNGGTVVAYLEFPIYDAQMRNLMLPRGCRVLGSIQAVQSDAQDRATIIFRQVVDPYGDQVQLLVPEPAADAIGMPGIEGEVRRHFGTKFGSALVWGLLSGLTGSGAKGINNASSSFTDVLQSNVASSFGTVGQSYLQSAQNIRPDILIQPNEQMRVILGGPIYLKPWKIIRPF